MAVRIRTSRAGVALLWLTDALGRPVGQQQLDLPSGTTILPLVGASALTAGV